MGSRIGYGVATAVKGVGRAQDLKGGERFLTDKGKQAGGEWRKSSKFGSYFLWPESFSP